VVVTGGLIHPHRAAVRGNVADTLGCRGAVGPRSLIVCFGSASMPLGGDQMRLAHPGMGMLSGLRQHLRVAAGNSIGRRHEPAFGAVSACRRTGDMAMITATRAEQQGPKSPASLPDVTNLTRPRVAPITPLGWPLSIKAKKGDSGDHPGWR
jgi:hypothetical protein